MDTDTNAIELENDAHEKLDAPRREDESFSDVVKRLTDEVAADWRHGFGAYADEGAKLERAVLESRRRTGSGSRTRQRRITDRLRACDEE